MGAVAVARAFHVDLAVHRTREPVQRGQFQLLGRVNQRQPDVRHPPGRGAVHGVQQRGQHVYLSVRHDLADEQHYGRRPGDGLCSGLLRVKTTERSTRFTATSAGNIRRVRRSKFSRDWFYNAAGITDGLSNTLFVGEASRFLNDPEIYFNYWNRVAWVNSVVGLTGTSRIDGLHAAHRPPGSQRANFSRSPTTADGDPEQRLADPAGGTGRILIGRNGPVRLPKPSSRRPQFPLRRRLGAIPQERHRADRLPRPQHPLRRRSYHGRRVLELFTLGYAHHDPYQHELPARAIRN